MIRCLDVLMILNTLGVRGIGEFIHRSVQTWNLTLVFLSYLWAASLGYGYPELFSIAGESKREILRALFMQKLPDMLVLFLLFIPASSRRFFRLQ